MVGTEGGLARVHSERVGQIRGGKSTIWRFWTCERYVRWCMFEKSVHFSIQHMLIVEQALPVFPGKTVQGKKFAHEFVCAVHCLHTNLRATFLWPWFGAYDDASEFLFVCLCTEGCSLPRNDSSGVDKTRFPRLLCAEQMKDTH